jgi:NADH dehydrogenase [ubiquinone] 1 alpha subcomplex assembly factor 6
LEEGDALVAYEHSLPGARSDLAALARQIDPDRYLTALFARPESRPHLFALIAFNYEIARVREVVTQPMLGQIRLQWWRDALEQIYAGRPPAHEVARGLAAAVTETGLDRARLEAMIDAREADLSDAPPYRLQDLIAYVENSAGALLELMVQALHGASPAAEEAARGVGAGYALVGLLRAIPFHARARRAFIPQTLLAEHGLTAEDLFGESPPAALAAAVAELAGLARLRLIEARELAGEVPRRAAPALLSATVAETYLRRIERAGYDVFAPLVGQRPAGLVWRLAAKAWTGRW